MIKPIHRFVLLERNKKKYGVLNGHLLTLKDDSETNDHEGEEICNIEVDL